MVCSLIPKPMNEKQRRFAEAYAANPNATEAAKAAGYSGRTARSQGQRLLTNVDVQKHIKELQAKADDERIASVTEIKIFWSEMMKDKGRKDSDRLKASDLLAKAAGVFLNGKENGKKVDSDPLADGQGPDRNDVIIYVPQQKSEEECQVSSDEEEDDGYATIYMPEIVSEESRQLPPETEVEE